MNDREPIAPDETFGEPPLQAFKSHGIPIDAALAASRLGRPATEPATEPAAVNGVVRNGVVVPDDPTAFLEGSRVRILPSENVPGKTFGERFARFKGAASGLPEDLASQHDHYRLGTPKQ
jgi:hypothetical protein